MSDERKKTPGAHLGVDYGERRVGLALSDATGLIATPLETLIIRSLAEAGAKIAERAKEHAVVRIIVGYPVADNDGESGERCKRVDAMVEEIRKYTTLPIDHQEERDSSDEAIEIFRKRGVRMNADTRRSGELDKVAAAVILQRWLDEH